MKPDNFQSGLKELLGQGNSVARSASHKTSFQVLNSSLVEFKLLSTDEYEDLPFL